ncbi:uncharacterized protein FTOL_12815 [Fusarium torulosum]|uniref:Uncharacterized protein n=1 Tax=Fusarium torulosum TaxID=33205 RepID=A0AAE8MML2_9HYPO|nr:uncharacterized protein FTOL_12815 [Fusarium torulosum]
MHTFKSLITFLMTAGLAVNAKTTSCVTSTRAFPTVTTTIVGQTSTWSGDAPGGSHGASTVYTAEFHGFCSTGLCLHTYTITEACKQAVCLPRTGVPPGFTSTVTVCNSCGTEPITATLTVPCVEAAPTEGHGSGSPSKSKDNNGKPKPEPEQCDSCHANGVPSSKESVPLKSVGSDSSVKPRPTEECTICTSLKHPSAPPGASKPFKGTDEDPPAHSDSSAYTTCGSSGQASQPPASMATSVSSKPSAVKPVATVTDGSVHGEPSVVTAAAAAKICYGELGILGIVGLGFIFLGISF